MLFSIAMTCLLYLLLHLLLSIFPTYELHEIRAVSVLFIVLYSVPGT